MARHWAETLACETLQAHGYTLLSQNYAVRGGEVDLVMQDGQTVVFIEVRQRRSIQYGTPAESITTKKMQRLRRTALHYLTYELGRDDVPVRFDAFLVTGTAQNYALEHLKHIAF